MTSVIAIVAAWAAAAVPLQAAGQPVSATRQQAAVLVAGAPRSIWQFERGDVVNLHVLTDRAGVSTAFWEYGPSVFATRSRADGTWRQPVRLGPGREPEGVVDAHGRVTLLWRALHGRDIVTQRRSHGRWRTAEVLTLDTGAAAYHVQEPYRIAVNAAGDTIAAWSQKNGPFTEGTAPRRLVTAFRPRHGHWQPGVQLARSGRADAAFVTSSGAAMVLDWEGSRPGLHVRTADGVWLHAEPVPAQGRLRGTASNAAGDLAVTTIDEYGATPVTVFDRQVGEPWGPGAVVGQTRTFPGQVPVLVDKADDEMVAFSADDGSASFVERSAGTDWPAATAVSATGVKAREVRLVRGPGGLLGLSWLAGPGEAPALWVAVREPSGSWSEAQRITPPRWTELANITLNAEPDGSLLAVWEGRKDGSSLTRIMARTVGP